MNRLWSALAALPTVARWAILSAIGLLVVVLIGSGVWMFLQRREAVAQQAFVAAVASYRQGLASGEETTLALAADNFKQFLREYPRSRLAGQAWYLLGSVEHQRRAFNDAIAAFTEAGRRDSGSVGSLSRLGLGYAWEAKGDFGRALEAYQAALGSRDPKDFLYGELLLAIARAQEELKQPEAAVKSYKRFLQDIPTSARAEEIRIRLAILGAGA